MTVEFGVFGGSFGFAFSLASGLALFTLRVKHGDVVIDFDLEHLYDRLAQSLVIAFIHAPDGGVGDNRLQPYLLDPLDQNIGISGFVNGTPATDTHCSHLAFIMCYFYYTTIKPVDFDGFNVCEMGLVYAFLTFATFIAAKHASP